MREHKYKAWDKQAGQWYNMDLFIMQNDGMYENYREFEDGISLTDKQCVLVQSTGLIDKNDQEIYCDSDYVKIVFWHGGSDAYTTYHDGNFDVVDPVDSKKYEYEGIITQDEFGCYRVGDFFLINLHDADAYSIEVIDNIQENPELFK